MGRKGWHAASNQKRGIAHALSAHEASPRAAAPAFLGGHSLRPAPAACEESERERVYPEESRRGAGVQSRRGHSWELSRQDGHVVWPITARGRPSSQSGLEEGGTAAARRKPAGKGGRAGAEEAGGEPESCKVTGKLMKAEKKKHLSPEKKKMKQKKKSVKHPKPQTAPEEDEPVLKKHKLNVKKQEEEETEEELSPEEKRILERKLKKERNKAQKKLMREAAVGAEKNQPQKPSGSELALDYLTTWSESPQGWKFQKTRQTWLLLHMYDKDQVPDQYFSILLRYLEGLQGRARDTTVQKAEALMKEYDQSDMEDDLLEEKCDRIRKVLQLLS